MSIESQIIGLMIVAVFVAATARRFRVPYTIALVVTGLGVGFLKLGPQSDALKLGPHMILVTLLPTLIFEAAYHIDLQELRENLRTILLLAIPGVILSTGIIGFLLHRFLGLSLIDALLFGSLISATDPVSVVALFKELGVDKRLSIVLEGESLFNDGVAIVLYSILLGVATGDQAFSVSQSLSSFFVTVAGGGVLGLVVGMVIGELMKRTDVHLLDIALTIILAYGTYLLAEEVFHGAVSPVIAVVVAAIYVGNYASSGAYTATSHVTIITFWEVIVFLVNSAIFLLIGLQVKPMSLVDNAVPVLIAIGITLLARLIVVYPMRFIVNRFVRPLPMRWTHVIAWGGLRGAVAMALALSLPETLASRKLLEVMAFGYVLFSLVVQGLTIRPLLNALGMIHISGKRREYEEHRGRIAMGQAALDALECMNDEQALSGPICEQIRDVYTTKIDEEWEHLRALIIDEPSLVNDNVNLVQREIINRQKQALLRLVRRGIISEQVSSQLSADIDEREVRMTKKWSDHVEKSENGSLLTDGGGIEIV
ncbi:MAG: Na+/H+ antiporter [Anaerolineae bacterium]|nr:Na+/H+ antiporter [Anaerolineae bacterium]